MSIAHKHCELIKAWADGAEIECLFNSEWMPARTITWADNVVYRIKPAEPSKLDTLKQAWNDAFDAFVAELEKGK